MSEINSAIQHIAGLMRHIEETKTEVQNHLILGLDVDQRGRPISKMLKTQAEPFELLGMIDAAMMMLQEARKEVRSKIAEQDKISRLVSKLPGELGDKIKNLELRMRAAANNMDKDEMDRIQKELDELLDISKGSIIDMLRKKRDESADSDDQNGPSDDDFNIKDFLGGL
jgi:hypothetical protein